MKKMKKHATVKISAAVWMLVLLLTGFTLLCCGPVRVSAASASDKTVPGKVTLKSVSAPAYNQVRITWKKASNATHYYIYYKETSASKWTKLASVKSNATGYTHTASSKYPIVVGKSYSYTVKAYNSTSKKYGSYNKKGLTVRTLPSTVKLGTATVNPDKISVNLTWEKAYGCDHYEVYRRTAKSSWKMIAKVKTDIVKYTDTAPLRGWRNIYTVRAYNSKTKVYGNYDKVGVFANVYSTSFSFPTIREAYMDVFRAINAGDMDHVYWEPENGAVNCEYFLYDMNKDSIPELIVGSDCQWDEEDKSYTRKICHVYTCNKTDTGYQAQKLNCYIWDPQLSADNDCLYGNYYWYSQGANLKYTYMLENNSVYILGGPKEYKIGDQALVEFNAKNPMPEWISISDYSELLKL